MFNVEAHDLHLEPPFPVVRVQAIGHLDKAADWTLERMQEN